jgi:hypothetical protein
MRLTIIPFDRSVIKDGQSFINLDLSSCNIPEDIHALQWGGTSGWLEFKSDITPNQDITELPDWATACLAKWEEEKSFEHNGPPTADANKRTALQYLVDVDWAVLPDVSDPAKSNPYLGNVPDYIEYRNIIRQYIINPVEGNIEWIEPPKAAWITT